MSIENGKCPGCGSAMKLDSSKEKMTCEYCGSEIVILQAIQKCQIDGITTFDSLILAADHAIKYDNDYDKALKKYKEALNLRPDDYRVLWGVFLCEMDFIEWYRKTKGFVQFPNDIPNCMSTVINKWGQRAYDLAPNDTKLYYWEKLQSAKEMLVSSTKSSRTKKKGCYIATAIYGSYNCPEVWTLRRYRDFYLAKSVFGRLFIKIYYTLSPVIIRFFGKTKRFNNFWHKLLNKKVKRLQNKGIESTPYKDKY